jgi:transposase
MPVHRGRKGKGSNDDWTHPHDPDAKITKMKDGRTHLAHKAEHAVDLETGAIVAVTVQDATDGDAATSQDTLTSAAENVEAVVTDRDGIEEVVADKGYHSNQELVDLEAVGVRPYISEPDRGRRNWKKHSEARDAVYRNRRRIRGARGKRLLRRRGERVERPCAHLYETGRMRRVHLRGHDNILKRLLIHVGAFNLGLLMRELFGIGTPRSLQGRSVAVFSALWSLINSLWTVRDGFQSFWQPSTSLVDPFDRHREGRLIATVKPAFATGC